jgi:hypothetical protein
MSQIKETHQRFQTPLIIHKSNLKHISKTAKFPPHKNWKSWFEIKWHFEDESILFLPFWTYFVTLHICQMPML